MHRRPTCPRHNMLLNPNSVMLCFYAMDNSTWDGSHSKLVGAAAKPTMNNLRTSVAKFLTSI
jgi:hypothetical protein